ncbi:Actin family protein [Trichomonas vaginalis G3]|uniref:Actin family protein n=1 Tax=Trichomonas vaginalis (strain ATCC PRA-98 / G3) TaxID=412133 RepID=A2D880_TRIV3|nr:ATP binding [Trichomonas vaginalis G3]EAY23513.1 Actin family protein [Trichomonas vaginalis G3]KAI5493935.1 ATP binding [Trichomonas vaginalis G3]|eukprot:XP_001584499.1 Actin family protein [Trichomonas vaginalis G3]
MNVVDNLHKALVYDFGSSCVRFGYAGDAYPLYVVPSSSVQMFQDGEEKIRFGSEWFEKNLPDIQINQMVDDNGMITESDMLFTFFDWVLSVHQIEEPTQNPVLISQPTVITKLTGNKNGITKWRETLASCIFEFANHPALCLQHDASLACYAHGIHTGVVVDYGWSCARAIPVFEGHPITQSVQIHPLGGLELTNLLFEKMKQNNKQIYTFLDPKPTDVGLFGTAKVVTPTPSQHDYCVRHEITNIIKNHLRYTDTPPKPNDEDILDYIYFMPGRRPLEIKDEINFLKPLLWQQTEGVPQSNIPLQNVVYNAIDSSPKDLHSTFWKNIITSGGLSRIPGFNAKLEQKARQIAPKRTEPHVVRPLADVAAGSRCVWTGGSIVASLPNFDQLCITKAEWEEFGNSILLRKCL